MGGALDEGSLEEENLLRAHLENGGSSAPEQAPTSRRRRNDEMGISEGRVPTTIMVNLASILEKTDEQLLPSVYKYVACSFKASPGATSGS